MRKGLEYVASAVSDCPSAFTDILKERDSPRLCVDTIHTDTTTLTFIWSQHIYVKLTAKMDSCTVQNCRALMMLKLSLCTIEHLILC